MGDEGRWRRIPSPSWPCSRKQVPMLEEGSSKGSWLCIQPLPPGQGGPKPRGAARWQAGLRKPEEDSVPLVLKPLPLLSRAVTSENLPSPLPPLAVPRSCWGRLVLGQLLRSPPPLPQLPLLRVPSASSQLSSFSWGSPPALSQVGGAGGSSRGQHQPPPSRAAASPFSCSTSSQRGLVLSPMHLKQDTRLCSSLTSLRGSER